MAARPCPICRAPHHRLNHLEQMRSAFARGVQRCWEGVVALGPRAAEAFDWTAVPRLPRRA